jgi:hypothetical protein
LLQYLDYGRARARRVISSLTDNDLAKTCGPKHPHAGKTLEQLLQINLAHLREHGGQIRGFLERASTRNNQEDSPVREPNTRERGPFEVHAVV